MKKVLATLVLAVLLLASCNKQEGTVKGKDGKELTVKTEKSVSITQDGTAQVEVTIERKNFDEPVAVQFKNLPTGVHVTPADDNKIAKGSTKKTFTLTADADAKESKGAFKVVFASDGMERTEEIAIQVKPKGTSSTSGSSPVSGTKDDLKQKRDELATAIKAKMKDIDATMANLREEAKTADAKIKVDLNKRIDELHAQRQNLSKEYDNIQTTTASNWNAYSARLTNAAHELAEGARKALDQFKKK